jgi:hypothetical protein
MILNSGNVDGWQRCQKAGRLSFWPSGHRVQWEVMRNCPLVGNNTYSQRDLRRVQLPCFVTSKDRRWHFF